MNITNNYSNNSFKAVRLSPHPAKWDQQVLGAVLNSKSIREIVKDDVKNNKDTVISYYKNFEPPIPECPANRDMYLTVIGGKDKPIELKSHATYWYIQGSFFRKPREIETGPKNVGKDLANKIRDLDKPQNGKTIEKYEQHQTLRDLEQDGKEIIYEEPIVPKDID